MYGRRREEAFFDCFRVRNDLQLLLQLAVFVRAPTS
jgi:hypothetical protein